MYLNLVKGMETISSLLNYLISIPMFGTQALPGTTTLMAKCKSNMTKFGLFWGLKSGGEYPFVSDLI